MLKNHKKTLIVTSLMTILPALIGLFLWDRLPDVMATHFGMNNEPDGFSSKVFAIFGIPLFCFALLWLGALIISHDPKKQNISPKLFTLVLWIIPIVSLVVAGVIYPYNLGYQMNISFFMELLTGLLFVVLGNYLPKARQNYTFGIRLPWTLADEENWNLTHRFAGYLWVAGGLLLIVLALTGAVRTAWLIGLLLAVTLAPCIYSYLLYIKKTGNI